MNKAARLNEVRRLLGIALDSNEETLYHGEMASYIRSEAVEAAGELARLFQVAPPSASEIECCVEALLDPARLHSGRSRTLLLQLGRQSWPILEALAASPDPQMRLFALETGRFSTDPFSFAPLYGTIKLNRLLLDDPHEQIRAAAISTWEASARHNAAYLRSALQKGNSNPLLELLVEILARLKDPADTVRTAAVALLNSWADLAGEDALDLLAERGNMPRARDLLARPRAGGNRGSSETTFR